MTPDEYYATLAKWRGLAVAKEATGHAAWCATPMPHSAGTECRPPTPPPAKETTP